jgi:hypothetical protein
MAQDGAWRELSSAVSDLRWQDHESAKYLKLGAQIGAAPDAVAGSVQWDKYQEIGQRLRRWERNRSGVGEPYWHHLARAGIAESEAMVKYASWGRRVDLATAAGWQDAITALLKQHCTSQGTEIVLSCS